MSLECKIKRKISFLFNFETFFVLFLFSGNMKGDYRLSWFPIDITLFFFVISLIVFFYIVFFKKKLIINIKINPVILLFISLALYMGISLVWSLSTQYSQQKVLFFYSLTSFSFLASWIIIAPEKIRIVRFLFWVVIFCSWMLLESSISILEGNSGFINVLGGNYLGVGRVLGLFAVIITSCVIMNIRLKLNITLLLLVLLVLLKTGARGPLVSYIMTFLLMMLCLFFRVSDRGLFVKKNITIFLIVIFFSFLYIYFFSENSTTIQRLFVLQEKGMGASAGSRLQHYIDSITYWLSAPILGHGIGSWPILEGSQDSRLYPHNLFAESLVELGLVGFIIFSLIFLFSFTLNSKKIFFIKHNVLALIIYFCAFYFFINAMFSGDFNDNRLLFSFIGLMNFLNLYVKERKNEKSLDY